jgi:orotidine-5'-phosphate decarboxylase
MTPALHPDSKRGAAAHRLIVALDLPTAQKARGLVSVLHGEVGIFKLGLELIYADGLAFARTLQRPALKRVFFLVFCRHQNDAEKQVHFIDNML